ncbi:hypothetical protein PDESU_05026 [Pontiella desulfatans]|uniref:CBM-cenC domain-containing protein n=1 Tax=Pontiella desulfatans TaxID=2750659 RepID=A0A6C2U8Y9_PONDE|nr:hypothetical protein [Pontiella desulfatans]VGO16435.1 hypothetical protein PDESU_05026 [Pontiella desulfatans]
MKMLKKCAIVLGFISLAGMVQAAVVSNLLQNADFEALDGAANEPNDGDTPWNAIEVQPWIVAGRIDEAHSGTQAVKVVNYNKGTITQNTGVLLESNTAYEASAWILTGGLEHASQTDPPELTISLYATTNGNPVGPYVYQAGFFFDQANTTNDTWEKVTGILESSSSALQDVVGEYIQLRFIKTDSGDSGDVSSYELFIDDAEFGVYSPEAPPVGLLLGYHTGIGTNYDYAVTGVEGSLFGASFDGSVIEASAGSSDGTYGTLSGASVLRTGYKVREGTTNTNSRVDVRIKNNTGSPLQLESISFDYGRMYEASPQDITLSYAYGNLNEMDNTEIFTATNLAVTGQYGDYHDFDIPLTNLNDVVLGDGQQATFRLSIDNAAGPWDRGAFDNIAIMGISSTEAWFVATEPSAADQVRLIVYASGDLSQIYLVGRDSLSDGNWAYTGHSDDGTSSYVITNLTHSTTDGTNRFIYVDGAEAKNFYGLEY